MYTFNQINKAFNNIAVAHKQINTYGMGDIWEIATSGDVQYPMMWAKPEDGSLEDNVYVSNWSLIFMDIVDNGERNENDVLSDMELVALDVVALLKDPDYDFDFDYVGATIERFTERFKDKVAGVVLRIGIRVPFTADRCQVPQSGLTITGGAGSQVSTSCASASALLYNTAGTLISTTSISSGGSSNITAPDATAVLKNSANTTLSTTSIVSNISTIINVSDGSYNILNSSGATVQSGSVVSAASNNITIPNTPVILLNSSGTTVGNGNVASITGGSITIDNATFYSALPIEYQYPRVTGQTTSYRTGDDANQFSTFWSGYFSSLKVGRRPQLSNFTTLISNNVFGNTNRFTDSVGGSTYGAGNGSITDYVIDHFTGLGWYRNIFSTAVWNTAIDGAIASTQGGFTDWRIPNKTQLMSLLDYSNARPLNYAPFSLGGGPAVAIVLWSSTTVEASTTFAFNWIINNSTVSAIGRSGTTDKTSTQSYLYFRKHF